MFNKGRLVGTETSMDFNGFNCPGGLTVANDGKSHPMPGTVF